jgi:methionyl-tRNA formyltransferase
MVVNNFSRLVPINLFLFSTYTSRIEKGKTGEPGTIIETTKKAIIVATGSDDAIALTDIQVAHLFLLSC